MLPMILTIAGLSTWFGGLVPRFGARLLLTAGPLVVAGGYLLLMRPGVGGSYWTTFFPPLIVLGLGMAISIAPLTTAVMGAVGEEQAGVASGINNAVAWVASLLAVAAFGLVMSAAFSRSFRSGLEERGLPPALAERVELERLAAAAAPPDLPAAVRATVAELVDAAFVAGFRRVMGLAAALAAASAAVAWATVRERRGRSPRGP